MFWFFAGDVGPYGAVEEPGLFLRFVGTLHWVYDADTDRTTAFSYAGTVTDVCALLTEP